MLAGFLVASSAAAIVGVYFLMSDYLMFINHTGETFRTGTFTDYDTAFIGGDLPDWLDQVNASQ